MSWFIRGVQSAVFHYASCAPFYEYQRKRKRRRDIKKAKLAKEQLDAESPDLYRQAGINTTNPYWGEEIAMGPGPPPQRARRTNTGNKAGSQRRVNTGGTQSTVESRGGSSVDIYQNGSPLQLSDSTLDDVHWNRRRNYQREDEELWGMEENMQPNTSGSSVGVTGLSRPATAKSSSESYCTHRAPPVNDLHPPVVSILSPDPTASKWMRQPPPKASVMHGKERPSTRSRSGSGASSRVELNLQRQVSARQLRAKLERGETPEMPSLSRGSSYNNFQNAVQAQRHDRDPRAVVVRPPSAASSYKRKKSKLVTTPAHEKAGKETTGSPLCSTPTPPPPAHIHEGLDVVRVRSGRQKLSTVVSSESVSHDPASPTPPPLSRIENKVSTTKHYVTSSDSSESTLYGTKSRDPLASSDISSLNTLQNLVAPGDLRNSRFVSAPLIEARIKLPPSDKEEETLLYGDRGNWHDSGFSRRSEWGWMDDTTEPKLDLRNRWSFEL